MNKSNTFFSIIFYAFAFSIIGIVSVYLGSKILIIVKSDATKLIFNAPVSTFIAIIFFAFWELLIGKTDKMLLIRDVNYLIYASFLSFLITLLIFLFVINSSFPVNSAKWRAMEYLFILIPVNAIIVIIKFYKMRNYEKNS